MPPRAAEGGGALPTGSAAEWPIQPVRTGALQPPFAEPHPSPGLLAEDGCSIQRQLDVLHDPIGLDQDFDDLLIMADIAPYSGIM